jgi:hypothetical protein
MAVSGQTFSGRWEMESSEGDAPLLTLTQSGDAVSGILDPGDGTGPVDLEGTVDRGFLRGWATGVPNQGRLVLWAEFAHDGLMVNLIPVSPDGSLDIDGAIQYYFLRRVAPSGEVVEDLLDVVVLLDPVDQLQHLLGRLLRKV